MKVKSNLFSVSRNLDSLVAALVGFILVQLFCRHSGIGISPDSVTYLSAARHLVQGRGFISFDNFPVVDFPFGYPFFLSAISLITGLDPLQFAPILNGILLGMLLYLSGSILNGFQWSSGWYKRIILLCILSSPAIQELYSMLWSETVSLLLILLFVVSMSHYLRKKSVIGLLAAAVVCALACLTRYAAVFLVPTGLWLILLQREEPWIKRAKHGLIFGVLSVSLFLVNILRNTLLTRMAMGQRPKNDMGPLKIAENFGGVICDWLSLDRSPVRSLFFTAVVLLVFAGTLFICYRREKKAYSLVYVMAATALTYALFMLATSMFTRYEQFTNRLLSPLFIPLLCCLSWWIPGFLARRAYRYRLIWTGILLLTVAWFINIQWASDYEFYDGVKDAGVPGYQEDPFVQSPIVQFVRQYKSTFDPGLPIYSNAGDAVYFVTGLPARQLPFEAFPAKVQQYYVTKNSYLVWFKDLDNPEMPSLQTIQQNKNLELVKSLADGAVFISK